MTGHLIDVLVICAILVPLAAVFLVGSLGGAYLLNPDGFTKEGIFVAYLIGGPLFCLAAVASAFCYRCLSHARSGQTVGKRVVGIRLVISRTGQPPGKGLAAGRELMYYLFANVAIGIGALLDLLWPLWDVESRTLHDKVVSTVVVKAR